MIIFIFITIKIINYYYWLLHFHSFHISLGFRENLAIGNGQNAKDLNNPPGKGQLNCIHVCGVIKLCYLYV